MTAAAFCAFAEAGCPLVVLEVGLGGRLDATTCHPDRGVVGFGSIGLDHSEFLGPTTAAIAAEKAGIIKKNVPVISGARHPDARSVIRAKCVETNSPLWELGVDYECTTQPNKMEPTISIDPRSNCASQMDFSPISARIPATQMRNLALRMPGKHQADNAAIAIAAWQRLQSDGWSLPQNGMVDALANTQLCCRIEVVSTNPTTVIDSSHNLASIAALISSLTDHFSPAKKTIIFACSKDKDYTSMLDQILDYADRLIVTQFQNNPRVVPVERLEEIAHAKRIHHPEVEILSAPSSQIAVDHATRSAIDNELICITGSFFLASETRPMFPNSSNIDI